MEKDRKFEVMLREGDQVVDSPVAHSWTAFLNGRWVREKPHKPGKYVIGNKNGRVLGEVFVYFYNNDLVMSIRDGALCKLKELQGDFWWWSVRMPQHMPIEVPRIPVEPEETSPAPSPLRLVVNNG